MHYLREFCVISTTVLVAASPLARSQSSNAMFALFAYGSDIQGFPVLYSDGLAYIGEQSSLNSSFQTPYLTSSSTMFVTKSNITASSNATQSQQLLALPPAGSTGQVSFVSNTSSDVITSGFVWYGHMAVLETSSGGIESLFFAQTTDTEGLWKLMWNSTAADNTMIPLALKDISPPAA